MLKFKPVSEKELAKAIGAKLADLRQHHSPGGKELSQARVASEAKISYRTYGKWETGQELPSTRKLNNLANFYQLPLSAILP